MFKKLFSSNTFKKTFFSYTAILVIPIIVFSTVNINNDIKKAKQDAYNMNKADAIRISDNVDKKLIELKSIGERMSNTTWVKKLMVDSDVYDDEFDILKKIELKKELHNITSESGILTYGMLIYPDKHMVISHQDIYDSDYFFSHVTKFDEETMELLRDSVGKYSIFNVMKPVKMKLWGNERQVIPVMQSLEMVNRPRAVLVLLVDSPLLKSSIQHIEGLGPVSISISDDDALVYKRVKDDFDINNKNMQSFTINSQACNWKYEIYYNNNSDIINIKNVAGLIWVIIISLIFGMVVAFFLAKISYKPLYALLNNISISIKNDHEKVKGASSEYSLIEKSINQLIKENNYLQQNIKDYKSAARGNALLMLIRGYFKDDQLINRLDEFGLNYTDDMYFCTLLVNFDYISDLSDIEKSKKVEIITIMVIEKIMNKAKIDYELFEVANADKAIIISAPNKPSDDLVKDIALEIMEEMQKSSMIRPDIVYGNVEKGLLGISKSYYLANENLRYVRFTRNSMAVNRGVLDIDDYYYPTDWEIQLINNLKLGNLTTVNKILDEIKSENEKKNLSERAMTKLVLLIMETMVRVLNELNIDGEIYEKQFSSKMQRRDLQEIWKYLYEVGKLICDRIEYSNTPSTVEIGGKLLVYVNKNYNSPDMSLKELSDVFNMSVSSASKIFKEVTGIKFSDYISRLRMERAKELLREKNLDINKVANMVGYENTYSFKRAFVRYEGVKPDEYISLVSNL